MNIIPYPKRIEINDGFLQNKAMNLQTVVLDDRILYALDNFEKADEGVALEIFAGQNEESEAYTLTIECDRIIINAKGNTGAFYAIQTLKQIFSYDEIPCCYIEDEPDFKYRGFYHDVTRGKVPTVKRIKKLIDDMAYYKLNSLQLYVEHTFEFKEFADSIDKTGYLSAEEIREIDDYCKMNFIDFIPSVATFGHLYELLEKDSYKHLREMDDYESEIFWADRMAHHTIDPTKEESFALVKSLIDQYMPSFSSDYFNICGDETFDLKKGKHKDENTGKLYIDFVSKLIDYVKSRNKTVMMWADILLNYPEKIDNLPEDVVLLNWYYWETPDEKTFETIKKSGCRQIVCPGTGSWSRLCENYELEITNITKMIDLGYKYSAEGVLNTNWGDWGNPCSIELAMFGLVLGAAKSWNVSTNVDEDYITSVNNLLYKNQNGSEYIKRLSELCSEISWGTFVMQYANIVNGKTVFKEIDIPDKDILSATVNNCFDLMQEIEADEWQDDRMKEQLILAAEGVAVMAELLAKCAGYMEKRKTDTKKWLEKYCEKWLEDNKESELREIEKMFLVLDAGYFL